jgi:hypothetical protein
VVARGRGRRGARRTSRSAHEPVAGRGRRRPGRSPPEPLVTRCALVARGWSSGAQRATLSPWTRPRCDGDARLDAIAEADREALRRRGADPAWAIALSLSSGTGGVSAYPEAAVTSPGPGALDVFVRDERRRLQHRRLRSGAWEPWETLSDAVGGVPCAVASAPSRVHVLVAGTDDGLYLRTHDGAWGPWVSLDGEVRGLYAATPRPDGRLDVFRIGPERVLYHRVV